MRKIMFNDKYGLTAAVLEGRKTVTRRIIQDKDDLYKDIRCMKFSHLNDYGDAVMRSAVGFAELQPYYRIGEVVAVAQPYKDCVNEILVNWGHKTDIAVMVFQKMAGWANKMFVKAEYMPYHIQITDIKVERLQDISHEDCLKEGIQYQDGYFCGYKVCAPNMAFGAMTAQQAFADLIDKVSGKGTWEGNPWVFAYEFKLVK